MNGLKKHITDNQNRTDTDWDAKEEMVLGVLEMYTQKDVWTSIDDTKFKTFKEKWEEIKRIYGGIGSMSSFNTWVAFTSTAFDDSNPMLAQFQL